MQRIVDSIFAELSPLFPGFRLDRSERSFVREIAEGSQKLLVPLVDLHPRYSFSLLCSVRLDQVEDICNLFNSAPRQYHSMTLTSTTPLKYFVLEDEYSVSTDQDIKEAAARLATVSGKIVSFMDQHQDKFALHRALNSEDGYRFDISVNPGRAMRTVILARLCGDADFREIVSLQEASISSWHEEDQLRFQALVDYLERMRP
jgi:hypothetical protein